MSDEQKTIARDVIVKLIAAFIFAAVLLGGNSMYMGGKLDQVIKGQDRMELIYDRDIRMIKSDIKELQKNQWSHHGRSGVILSK